jgi:orotate phosphoribosyltransferase
VQEVRDSFGLPVVSILTLSDLIGGVREGVAGVPAEVLPDLEAYRARYGVTGG